MKFLQPCRDYLVALARDAAALWDRVWFTPADPINLAAIRIITGLILLHIHLGTLPDLLSVIGPHAWLDAQGVAEMHRLLPDGAGPGQGPWHGGEFSIWFYVREPWMIWDIHGLFLAAAACLTLGFSSRIASVLVWAGHLSHMNRGIVTNYGMDTILAMLTLYLMLSPCGAALSLDQWRKRRRTGNTGAAPQPGIAANVVLRLLQFHLCLIYLFSGLSKLSGGTWWNGTAVYTALMIPEATLLDMGWIARHDWLWMPLSNAGSLATLAVELGFPILVWNRRLRPLVLACVIAMQVAFGFLLGLGAFQAAMFAALVAFLPPKALRRAVPGDW